MGQDQGFEIGLEIAEVSRLLLQCPESRICCALDSVLSVLLKQTLTLFSGDLKLVEKPQPIMLGPNDFSNIKVPFFYFAVWHRLWPFVCYVFF